MFKTQKEYLENENQEGSERGGGNQLDFVKVCLKLNEFIPSLWFPSVQPSCVPHTYTHKRIKYYVKVGDPHFELRIYVYVFWMGSLPGGSMVKNSPANAGDEGDLGSISGSGRSPGGVNGNPLQYSCLENSMDRGAWWVNIHWVTKSWT